jgi:hypothetical protein
MNDLDLVADLNAQDDDGHAQAVVRVVAVDEDGQVHFLILSGQW